MCSECIQYIYKHLQIYIVLRMCAKCIECIYINIYIFILGIPLSVQRRHADSVLSILSIYINIHIFTCRKSPFFFFKGYLSNVCQV